MDSRCKECGAKTDEFGRALPAPQADGFRNPSFTADAGVVRRTHGVPEILLITRGHSPFKGYRAFPGGFVDYNEEPLHAGVRELEEETGLKPDTGKGKQVKLVGLFGNPLRDPRKHIVTALYHIPIPSAESDEWQEPKGGDDAAMAAFYPIIELWSQIQLAEKKRIDDEAPEITAEYGDGPYRVLAFDHHVAVKVFIEYLIRDGFFTQKECFEMGFRYPQTIS